MSFFACFYCSFVKKVFKFIEKKDFLCILPTDFRKALIFQPLLFVLDRLYVYLSFRHRGTAKFVYGLAVVIDYAHFIVHW